MASSERPTCARSAGTEASGGCIRLAATRPINDCGGPGLVAECRPVRAAERSAIPRRRTCSDLRNVWRRPETRVATPGMRPELPARRARRPADTAQDDRTRSGARSVLCSAKLPAPRGLPWSERRQTRPISSTPVVRAQKVVEAFGQHGEPLRLRDVVERTGLSKNLCFRLLYTLRHCGVVEKVDVNRYRARVRRSPGAGGTGSATPTRS